VRALRIKGRLVALVALALLALLALPVFHTPASAHEVRPAYLQIDRLGEHRYAVLWRTPLLSGAPLPVALSLPAEAEPVSAPKIQTLPGSIIERQVIDIPGGLAGKRIDFIGLEATITDVLVRIDGGDGNAATTVVRPSQPWIELDPDLGTLEIALSYLRRGVDHILYGIDHLLFVASLMLIVRGGRMLVKTVTAFTVAHSITLALAVFGVVTLPAGPVEAMVALSIVLVCVEAVRLRRGETSLAISWPWLVAFAFGLLHGFGFAGALLDLGLPRGDIPLALLFFNIGVEMGQLLFIAAILAVALSVRRIFAMPRQAPIAAAYAMGITAAFWGFERLDAIFF
jgi:hypothetical protein